MDTIGLHLVEAEGVRFVFFGELNRPASAATPQPFARPLKALVASLEPCRFRHLKYIASQVDARSHREATDDERSFGCAAAASSQADAATGGCSYLVHLFDESTAEAVGSHTHALILINT